MAEWKSLTSKLVLDEKAKVLRRKCRGHYYSNYVWFSSVVEREFPYSSMWFIEDGDNMLVLQQYNHFFKLFYFVGDIEHLKLSFPKTVYDSQVLCEYFEEEGKEKQTEIYKVLLECGFAPYRKFYMWECDELKNEFSKRNDLCFDNVFTREQLKELLGSFDPYVDLIPLPELFEDYYNQKRFLTCYVDGEYAGVVVYTIKDSVIDEDFIYVKPQYRGIGKYLYVEFLKLAFFDLGCKKVVPWVHVNNVKSNSFHEAAGAKKTPFFKMSLLTNLNIVKK